ncbi:MAG: hypothetical protein OHK0013_27800 [Sandaracinaceae bacterium]
MNDVENAMPEAAETAEPKNGRVKVDFVMHLAKPSRRLLVREGPAPVPPAPRGRMPRVARMLVQAHLFQRMLETGQASDLADLARRQADARPRHADHSDSDHP